jgi:hypothetical protein
MTSRDRYKKFVDDYRHRRLEDPDLKKEEAGAPHTPASSASICATTCAGCGRTGCSSPAFSSSRSSSRASR